MDEQSREHLSALMDGEISREAGRFLVRRLGTDDDLHRTWARYHVIRDCLRYQDGSLAQPDLVGRMRRALSDEPQVPARSRFGSTWLKPLAGLAIAASVALFAVLTVSEQGGPGQAAPDPDASASQVAVAESFTSPNISRLVPQSQTVSLSGRSGADNSRMNAYLLRHYQVSEEAGGRGFVSFVPIVVTQAQRGAEGSVDKEDGEIESVPR
jgi:sigma-E factor negative regulatory protein RseA